MQVFLVRMTDGHQLIGIFVGAEPSDIFYSVDQVIDPACCEYTTMPSGDGIYWSSRETEVECAVKEQRDFLRPELLPPVDVPIPLTDDEWEDGTSDVVFNNIFLGAQFGLKWGDALTNKKLKWKQLANPGWAIDARMGRESASKAHDTP